MTRAMISNVRLTPASADDQSRGLLGWLSLTAGLLRLDGLTLRRTRRGRLTVSYPVRLDGKGRMHPVVWPVDVRARRTIEHAILTKLGFLEAAQR